MQVDMKIEGLEELARKSKQLNASFERGTLRTALRNAAKPVRKYARRDAPKQEGTLRRQIKTKAKVKRNGFGYVDIAPTTDAPYGGFVELGTEHRGEDPYLVPALDEAESDGSILESFVTALNKTIAAKLGST